MRERKKRVERETFTFVCAIIALHNLLRFPSSSSPRSATTLTFTIIQEKVSTRRKFFQRKIFGQVVRRVFLVSSRQAPNVRCSNSITTYDTIIAVIRKILLAARLSSPPRCCESNYSHRNHHRMSKQFWSVFSSLFHFPFARVQMAKYEI